MPKQESDQERGMRQALTAYVDAKDPLTRGRLLRRLAEHAADDDRAFIDYIDVVFSLDDPVRQSTKADVAAYLREHPGRWTAKQDDDLRAAVARDRSLRRFW